jgi:hypothetical protein
LAWIWRPWGLGAWAASWTKRLVAAPTPTMQPQLPGLPLSSLPGRSRFLIVPDLRHVRTYISLDARCLGMLAIGLDRRYFVASFRTICIDVSQTYNPAPATGTNKHKQQSRGTHPLARW